MKIRRPWTTKHWCKSVIEPEWPFAYSKYDGQIEESKGRVSSNRQDVRHKCQTQGVQSKCHICEEIQCGMDNHSSDNGSGNKNDKKMAKMCHFQLQGVSWDEMSKNIPTITDVPWAVGGGHRYDYGGENTTHVCMYMSSGKFATAGSKQCQSHLGKDYSACVVRCWGYSSKSNQSYNNEAGPTSKENDHININAGADATSDYGFSWPNLKLASTRNGLNTTPWVLPQPIATWSYPKSDFVGDNITLTYNVGPELDILPQGFTFTLAGSGEEGFQDGKGTVARFRHPEGITASFQGFVFVADTGNHAIRMITPSGFVSTVAGTGYPGFQDGTSMEKIKFSNPSGIAVWQNPSFDANDNNSNEYVVLFVADTGNHRIRKVTGYISLVDELTEKKFVNVTVECFCGNCNKSPQAGYADGDRNISRFDNPVGITIGGSGTIFVTDTNNHLIRTIDQFGEVNTLAGKLRVAEVSKGGGSLEGCPDPCLTGAQGHEDGEVSLAKFSFPLGIALSSDESYLLVTSRHYLRKIDFKEKLVMTANGNNRENEVDGQGQEASFNKPHGVTITKDGYAFIVDSASCRIRRVATPALFAAKLNCFNTMEHVFRPSGCSSYNAGIDQHGLKATSRSGYIQYNYKYREWTNKELGNDYIGRGLKNCVGVPPQDSLDKKGWNDQTLVIDDGRIAVREDPNEGSLIQVVCPTYCSVLDSLNLTIYGIKVQNKDRSTLLYTEESPICIAAAHAGLLNTNFQETYLDLIIHRSIDYRTNYSNFVYKTKLSMEEKINALPETSRFYSLAITSQDFVVQTIAGSSSAKRGEFCGFEDSIPAQGAKFNIPTSISAFVNSTLNDNTTFLYVADRDNHVVRAISATCSFVCENGGRCIGSDKCSCPYGWEGLDCSIPICLDACNQRQICVGPNQCDCIPGFKGHQCLDATCAQNCENGGLCTAPDSCLCSPGWFDSNCTTPVCSQTCGNGGNCTAPNYCTCPSDWTGVDCRQPVCEQSCLNGGICIAPNTCSCPPSWSGYNCSEPVCHQGFFEPYEMGTSENLEWMEYVPCNIYNWCNITNSFDCSQKLREFIRTSPLHGSSWRFKTGLSEKPYDCFMIELQNSAKSSFQYINSFDNKPTKYQRYTNLTPNDYFSEVQQSWNARTQPHMNYTKPWTFLSDRQVALVETRFVTQGSYKCANNGKCVAPDTCACSHGWIGFDCRVPVCEQGYFEPDQQSFVKGINDEQELQKFKKFLHPSHTYFLDPKNGGYSNPHYTIVRESYKNNSYIERETMESGGKHYIRINGDKQGGYECSIRSVTEWEDYRSGTIFEHPNYYSRYMDQKVERDGKIYTNWEKMGWDPLFEKTNIFQLNSTFLGIEDNDEQLFVYTDKGYQRDGFWQKTNSSWTKGYCIIEFERVCENKSKGRDLEAILSSENRRIVQDTDLSFRPRIQYDNDRAYMSGEWRSEDGECIDQVFRGCFNNGTCIGPNECKCADGWIGHDCTTPICSQDCKHNGNCTLPNICTCEKGWRGHDCSIPICAQNCNNGGKCVAPDTCKCLQWENNWRDGRFHGGVPLYQTPTGDPQMTGWTGYDCSTPICVQAEKFIHIINTKSYQWNELVPLGGHGKDGTLRCDKVRCPEYDKIVTINNGKSFQSGCGFDPIDTGCCFEIDTNDYNTTRYSCFICHHDNKIYTEDSLSCPTEKIERIDFQSIQEVTKDFRDKRSKEVNLCGPSHDPVSIVEANLTSRYFLCERYEWEQGDYIDNAGLSEESGIGASNGLVGGRHVRLNYHNYVRSKNNLYDWSEGIALPGEGVFACYNGGSCIKPDLCTCKDGYTGFDCKTPLCRHQQMDGTVVGCLNHGHCVEKDNCKCKQEQSVLWMSYEFAERGITGWSGSDCSMPICSQGYYDPECINNPFSVGGEGCYRCQNDGLCVAPDVCQCAEGWTGFDCKTPVCKLTATPLIKKQLMTVDKDKIELFENDPCGMEGFHDGNMFKSKDYRGFCAGPNQCTCHCKGIHDALLCKAFGGIHCNLPFQDRLTNFRNVLLPNQIFGTRSCYSGYEGAVDENDKFVSCHLEIYEPSYLIEKSISFIFWGMFILLPSLLAFFHYRIKSKRIKMEEKIQMRKMRRGGMARSSNFDAFSSFRRDPGADSHKDD